MLTPKLLPYATFKKDYNFYWRLGKKPDDVTTPSLMGNIENVKNKIEGWSNTLNGLLKGDFDVESALKNIADAILSQMDDYVSAFAYQVRLPEDSVELDSVKFGLVDFPVVKKRNLGDITVTYYEDSFGNVYNYHKIWQNLVFGFGGKYMPWRLLEQGTNYVSNGNFALPLTHSSIPRRAIYVSYENSLTAEEFMETYLIKRTGMASALEDVYNLVGLSTDRELFDFLKPTSINEYPQLYPYKIERSEGSKGSSKLSTITVTYKRIPWIAGQNNLGVRYLSGRDSL